MSPSRICVFNFKGEGVFKCQVRVLWCPRGSQNLPVPLHLTTHPAPQLNLVFSERFPSAKQNETTTKKRFRTLPQQAYLWKEPFCPQCHFFFLFPKWRALDPLGRRGFEHHYVTIDVVYSGQNSEARLFNFVQNFNILIMCIHLGANRWVLQDCIWGSRES